MTDAEEFSTEEIPHGKLSKQVAGLTAEVAELKQQMDETENKFKNLNNILSKVVNHLGDDFIQPGDEDNEF